MTIRKFQHEHAFLSNFWPSTVVFEGGEFASVEHAYQAAKFPPDQWHRFRNCPPGQAKRQGKRPGRRADWDEVKLSVMRALVEQKFALHTELRHRLRATGDREIVEGNTWGDTYWGQDLATGEGENHLGKILMAVRASL